MARRPRPPGTSPRRVLLPDEQLLNEYQKWISRRIFCRGEPPPTPEELAWARGTNRTNEDDRAFHAAVEKAALADARRRDTRSIGWLLEKGRLSPQGMAVLIDLLKRNFPRPVGRPLGDRMNTPVQRAVDELPAMVKFLTERHAELTPAFRKHGIRLVAKRHHVLEETVRNRVDRGRRRNRV